MIWHALGLRTRHHYFLLVIFTLIFPTNRNWSVDKRNEICKWILFFWCSLWHYKWSTCEKSLTSAGFEHTRARMRLMYLYHELCRSQSTWPAWVVFKKLTDYWLLKRPYKHRTSTTMNFSQSDCPHSDPEVKLRKVYRNKCHALVQFRRMTIDPWLKCPNSCLAWPRSSFRTVCPVKTHVLRLCMRGFETRWGIFSYQNLFSQTL